GAYALLIGFLILFATAVNDILYSRQVIQTGYLGPLGLFLFIFSQAVLLSMRFSTAFHTVEQQGLALRDMNLTNRQEIEERLKTEAALRESELKYRFLADSVSDTIWTVDPNTYRFTYASPSARDLLGYSIEELTAMTLRDVLDAQSLDLTRKAIGGDLEAGSGSGDHPSVSATFELEPIGKDGKRIWTETTVNVIRHPDDGRTTVIGVTRDISERKHAEEKLRATLSEKELLLQEIHHRVKNNLQVVISLLSLQSRNETDDRVLQAIQVSQNRVRAMALVHEFIYRSESLAEINVADYLNGLVNHLSGAFLGSGLAPRVNIQVPKDLTIHLAFAVPCGLILNELISNSLKYAFSGRSDGEITIAAGLESDGRIRLMVQDNGVGLPEDFNWRESGTLGLSMVAGLIEGQLQGAIELDRESGTRWTMTFRGNK
ncbi:MAG: PAS domain S-box protein, partial [Proteobacteria bacterium]|nr:PAS domain S-box protein [Pseudomonadota bacterium]